MGGRAGGMERVEVLVARAEVLVHLLLLVRRAPAPRVVRPLGDLLVHDLVRVRVRVTVTVTVRVRIRVRIRIRVRVRANLNPNPNPNPNP